MRIRSELASVFRRFRVVREASGHFRHLPDFFASAAACSRSLAMVAAEGSLRLLFFFRRLVLVV